MAQKNSKSWVWILAIIALVLLVGMGVYYWYFIKNKTAPEASISPSASVPTSSSSSVNDPGVEWLKPQILGDLNLIKVSQDSGIAAAKYYKIASLEGGGELDLASLEFEGPAVPIFYRFKKGTDGKYSYLLQNSSEKDTGVLKLSLKDSVTIDEKTVYKSLSPSENLEIKNSAFKSASSVGWFKDLQNPKEVGSSAYGKMYRSFVNSDATEMGGAIFSLKLADSTYLNYVLKPAFITDDEVAQVTWSDSSKNAAKYTSEGYVGCSMNPSVNVILNTDDISSRLKEAGKTSTGEKIYTVSKDDPVMTMAYNNYKIGRDKDALSLADFAAKNPVFIYKDGLGDYVIYTGRDFAGLAECGKPVIYLYPETPMAVSVKVGAKISKSEPNYQNGWNVFAMPNGKLLTNGKIYESLFWEGRGTGEYPIVSNQGVVVKKENVAETLKNQLGKLGLNEKEIADFMEFWLPKMPEAPFVRLTWLGTQEMNQIAPLSISPAPDTLIRVFLDFEGLAVPINLEPQKLSSRARNGFTVVEWGGLLR